MFSEFHHTDIAAQSRSREIVGLLELYAECAPEGGPVAFETFFEAANARFGRFLVSVEPSGDSFCLLTRGPAVAVLSDVDPVGRTLEAVPDQLGSFLASLYSRTLAESRPIFAVHRALSARHVHLWERVALPALTASGEARIIDLAVPREYQADLLSTVLEASCDGIISVRAVRGADGAMTDAIAIAANGQAAHYLGVPIEGLREKPIRHLFEQISADDTWQRCCRALEDRRMERFEVSCLIEGLDTALRITATPLGDGLLISLSDITDLRYALIEMELAKEQAERARLELVTEISARRMVEGELRRIATTDGLTGVLNRRGFQERIDREAATARRYGYPLSVIGIDIDHFKRVNDLHGHAAGDLVLMMAAALFMEEIRTDSDFVGRVGGEEFMVLLPHTGAEGAALLAERLREKLSVLPIMVGETTITVTASFGVSELKSGTDAEATVIQADDALYRAKRSGRNRVVIYDPDYSGDDVRAVASDN